MAVNTYGRLDDHFLNVSYVIITFQAEIDGRQKAIASLQKEAEAEDQPEKIQRVANLATSLDQAWLQRKQFLTQVRPIPVL